MDVIDATFQVLFVAYRVFPVAPLPNAPFLVPQPGDAGRDLLAAHLQVSPRELLLDSLPADRVAVVSGGSVQTV
jgi:hypothetical protein